MSKSLSIQPIEPDSGCPVVPVARVSCALSQRFWGFDLCEALPYEVATDGVVAQRGELSRIRTFLASEYPSLTEDAVAGGKRRRVAQAKRDYLEAACDLIELRHHERTVGVLVGAPEDWSSYYIRIFAVLQAYQRPRLIRRFCRDWLFERLRAHDVQRVIADTSPANIATSRTLTELRFHVTGHQLSDRWGPLVRYTKFLDPACERAFLKRFAGIAPPGSEGRGKEVEQ